MRSPTATLALALLLGVAGCGTAPSGSTAAPTPSGTVSGLPSPSLASPPAASSRPTASPSPVPSPVRTLRPEPAGTPTPARQPTTAPEPAPASGVPPSLGDTDWTRIPTTRRVVALTFDGGGDAAGLASILATLDRTGTPATFFLTGSWVRAYPAQARRLAALGVPLGNHSDSHPHLPRLTNQEIARELAAAERSLVAATGRHFDPLFRFPFGDTTPLDIRVVNDLGYVSVRWTVDTLGWQGTSSGRTARQVVDRVLRAATPGAIVLMHLGAHPSDRSTLDADALPAIVSGLRDRGYRLVTLEALLDAA